mmetsp:Transcript_12999/g.45699  ORF Transcript_12999/g.45699 Transcript_12999/m.45699 type:complete len:237 (+) Transcript_12999:517-1227(+)
MAQAIIALPFHVPPVLLVLRLLHALLDVALHLCRLVLHLLPHPLRSLEPQLPVLLPPRPFVLLSLCHLHLHAEQPLVELPLLLLLLPLPLQNFLVLLEHSLILSSFLHCSSRPHLFVLFYLLLELLDDSSFFLHLLLSLHLLPILSPLQLNGLSLALLKEFLQFLILNELHLLLPLFIPAKARAPSPTRKLSDREKSTSFAAHQQPFFLVPSPQLSASSSLRSEQQVLPASSAAHS